MAEQDPTPSPAPEESGKPSRPAPAESGEASPQAESAPSKEARPHRRRGKRAAAQRRPVYVERRRGFLARWLGRLAALLLILALLLLLVFVVVTVVLRTDVPRTIGQRAATEALGLQVAMDSVDVGWGGDITLRNLVLRLPSAEGEGEKILEVPRMRLEVGALARVGFDYLFGQSPQLRRVEIESPTVFAVEDEQGQWNLIRAATLASSGGGPRTGPPSLPPLPEIRVTDGRLVVRRKDGLEASIDGFDLEGGRENLLVYTLAGSAPDVLEIRGELFPATGARQQIDLELLGLPEPLREMFGLPQVALAAGWRGGLTEQGVEGIIEIESSRIDQAQIEGQLRFTLADGVATLQPVTAGAPGSGAQRLAALRAENLPGDIGPIHLMEGTISAFGGNVVAQRLVLHAMEGEILVHNASADLADFGLNLAVDFKNLRPRGQADLSGSLRADARYNIFGEPVGRVDLEASGEIAGTTVQRLALEMLAHGPVYHDWRTLDISVTLKDSPLLIRPPDAPTQLPEAEGQILIRLQDIDHPRIELAYFRSLQPEVMEIEAAGAYYTGSTAERQVGEYVFQFMQRGFPVRLPRVEDRLPLYLGFDLEGRVYLAEDPEQRVIAPVEITRLYGELADVELEGFGQYVILVEGEEPDPPLTLELTLQRQASIPAPQTPGAPEIAIGQRRLDDPARDTRAAGEEQFTEAEAIAVQPIRGRLESWLNIRGDPMAMRFEGEGGILTADFSVGPFDLGTIRSDIEVGLTSDHLTVRTPGRDWPAAFHPEYAQVFGAHIDFTADIPFRRDLPGHISLAVEGMDLGLVAEGVASPVEFAGRLDGRLAIDLTGLSPRNATARGWFVVDNLRIPQSELAERIVIGLPPEHPEDDPAGGVLLSEGMANIPVQLQQQAVLAPGPTRITEERELTLTVSYDLDAPRQIQLLNVNAERYPLILPPAESGGRYIETEVNVSASSILLSFADPTPHVDGDLIASALVRTGSDPFDLATLAEGDVAATAATNRIELDRLVLVAPEIGVVTGGGVLDLVDVPVRSRIYLHAQAVNLETLGIRLDLPEGARGLLDFSLTLQPGPGERPQGDVLVNFAFRGDEARWQDVRIEQGQVMFYLSRLPRPDDTPTRGQFDFTLLTTERIRLQLADGVIDGYLKLRNRGGAHQQPGGFLERLANLGDDWYINASLSGRNLNLRQLGAVAGLDVRGRGHFSLLAYGNVNPEPGFDEEREDMPLIPFSGEGVFAVTQGRLGNLLFFQRLLDLVNAVTRVRREDTLDARFRVEQGNFHLDRMEAFVDGMQAHATGRLYDVFDIDETRLDLSGVAYWRPLTQIPLPLAEEVDEILGVIQTNLTGFRATGTFKDPDVRSVLLSEVAETLRVLLIPNLGRR